MRNLITDVAGILVGNAEAAALNTGSTIVLCEAPAVAAVDMRGGGPGTRETDLLQPACLVDKVDAVALSGGSVFGLAAADGAVEALNQQGRGYRVGPWHLPIVPAAILFDLPHSTDPSTAQQPPYRTLGRQACENAGKDFALGNAGAGLGARAGAIKGGLGSCSLQASDGFCIGAIAAANPVGSVLMPNSNVFWAWPYEQGGEFGGRRPDPDEHPTLDDQFPPTARLGGHTTIVVVATDLDLNKAEAQRLAIMAQDGLARAIRPVHTPFDGDTVFVLATGHVTLSEPRALSVAKAGMLAADCVARAIARGVFQAESLAGVLSYQSRLAGGEHQG